MRNQINRIKKWNQFLNEAVGVPPGIALSARKIYWDIISFLEENPEYVKNEEIFVLGGNYAFADFDISEVSSKIRHFYGKISDYRVISLGFGSEAQVIQGRLKYQDPKNVHIRIDIARPKNTELDSDKVISLLKTDNVPRKISSIAHELKHGYDHFKKIDGGKASDFAIYKTFSEMKFGNRVVDEFVYNSYYVSLIENLVRPSQIYTLANESGVTKKDFVDFLKKTDVYKILQKITTTSYEDFRKRLKKNMKFVNKVIQNFQNEVIPPDDEGKIDLFLKGIYITLNNYTERKFREILSDSNPLIEMIPFFGVVSSLGDEDQKLIDDFRKKLTKYKGREVEYFKYTIGENQYQTNQVIKRLGKIYSILPDILEEEK